MAKKPRMAHEEYLKMALEEAMAGIRAGAGGPFGAVIVRERVIIGRGHNTVLQSRDPTAHAEINAIRDACRKAQDHQLTGAFLYSNFEPCPMCLSALYWSDIRNVYFCSGRLEAERIGFMDNHLYRELLLPEDKREVRSVKIPLEGMSQLLDEWERTDGKLLY